jgi:2-keto-4-pentenoate hydratase/2-oxohepta-3-ene-1,7-dioic acid hydratase in catechol pathway
VHLTRFLTPQGDIRYGIDLGDATARLLDGCPITSPHATPTGQTATIAKRLAPLTPANIFCIGLNYRQHAIEGGAQIPDEPVIFMKPTTALNHPDHPINIPACAHSQGEVDYECELAVIIAKPTRNVREDDALDYVFGYTCANDVSARRWQKQDGGGQWIRGKSFDTFCPLGPVIVTADQIPDPQILNISTTLNGQVMQNHNTADMIFPVAKLIAFLSMDTTLLPGTVILTGTPQGVGCASKPPIFLKPGDTVTIEIDHIGKLTNPVTPPPMPNT